MCSATGSRNPLHQADILQRVLGYVGPGHWCFVAEASRLWREMYAKVSDCEVQVVRLQTKITCVPQMTLFSAGFASPSRVRLAKARELPCTTAAYQQAAGMHADVATMEAAVELGMSYTEATMEGAARCNKLAVVQFLHTLGCPWDTRVFNAAAARGDIALCAYLRSEQCPWTEKTCDKAILKGHVSTLSWLREHGCPWNLGMSHLYAAQGGSIDMMVYVQQQRVVFTAQMLTHMLKIAGVHNKLAAAKWLRHEGAAWPNELSYWRQPWSGDVLEWARAEGCTAPVQLT
jgi:hypothetical protein